jgi:hypothetical protein
MSLLFASRFQEAGSPEQIINFKYMTTNKILFIIAACFVLAPLFTALTYAYKKGKESKPAAMPRVYCSVFNLDFAKDKKIETFFVTKSLIRGFRCTLGYNYKGIQVKKMFKDSDPSRCISKARDWWNENKEKLEEASKL